MFNFFQRGLKMIQKIETCAPGFSGFYESIWTFDEESVLDFINEDRRENDKEPIETCDDIDVDYTSYRTHIGREYCNALTTNVLHPSIISVDFKDIESPREYNFTTDKIACEVTIDTDKISEWVKENREELTEYVHERFMRRDGFIPFYSNDITVWDEATNGFTNFDFDDGWVYLNSIMEVMFNENDNAEMDIFCDTEQYYGEFVTNWEELVTK